jgi:hypothetical protein
MKEKILKAIMPLVLKINKEVDIKEEDRVTFALNFIRDTVNDRLELLKQEEPIDERR